MSEVFAALREVVRAYEALPESFRQTVAEYAAIDRELDAVWAAGTETT